MEYLRLPLKLTRSPEYIGSEPLQRATWLNLLAYCAEQENGGRILGCFGWKDRMWQQLVGVTYDEVHQESSLYHFDGDDLVVFEYPEDAERLCLERRNRAREANANRWSPTSESTSDPTSESTSDPTSESLAKQSKGTGTAKQSRGGSACGKLDLDEVEAWIDAQNGRIPDKPRAKALARELIAELSSRDPPWTIQGQPIANPMGVLVGRLKKDHAYK